MIRAILFDCNGVIVNDEPLHMRLFQKVLKEEGVTLTRKEYYEKYLAMDDRGCFFEALKEHRQKVSDERVHALIARKAEYYRKAIVDEYEIFDGVKWFVNHHRNDFVLGVVSGALRSEIEFILERAGLRSAFSVIVSAEDVHSGKPSPECYLKGLEKLNALESFKGKLFSGEECLAIEDSIHGVEAAKKAGMKCLAVTNSYPKEMLGHADVVIQTLQGFDVRKL